MDATVRKPAYAMKLNRFELTNRTARCFEQHDITTVGQLAGLDRSDVRAWPNAGAKTLSEINSVLRSVGVRLGEAKPRGAEIPAAPEANQADAETRASARKVRLDRLPLSTRTANCLAEQGIKRAGQLARLTPSQVLEWPKAGQKTLYELRLMLGSIGLSLREDDAPAGRFDRRKLERWLLPEGSEARSDAVPADAAPDAERANSMSEIAGEFRARTARLLARIGPEPRCLEEELGRIVALVESGRNVALLKSLWGWNGADRRTLAAVAEDHGVVRERIRQISARAIQRIRKHELDTPYLRAAIQQLSKEKPSDQRLTTRLRDHAIARGPFSIRGLNLAAKLLGVEGGPIPILKKPRRVAFGMVDRGQPARRL